MKPEKILLPIDVTKCPPEVFELANSFAKRAEVTVILLHVVHLNIVAPENRVYEELGREAQWYLGRLADKYLHPLASTLLHVRTGRPAEEILAEAKSEKVDLIILPTYGPSFWARLTSLWKSAASPLVSALAAKIIQEATCAVFVVGAKTRFNCERVWGRPGNEIGAKLEYPGGAAGSESSPALLAEDAFTSTPQHHHAAV
jgi:nucleotide-binding universal stress UspA family protein